VIGSGTAAVLSAIAASGIMLFTVGATMSLLTGRPPWFSGGRMLLIGGALATVTYGVGTLLNVGTGVA